MTRTKAALNTTFESLGVRNFRLFFIGQLVSISGSWMQSAALAWLVLLLTGSGSSLGLFTAAQYLPLLVLSPYGGVIADRFPKLQTLKLVNVVSAGIAVLLAVLTATDLINMTWLYALALITGLTMCIEIPTRQSFVSEIVGGPRLQNALSLQSTIFSTGRAAGPAIGALLIKFLGVWPCFAINAASFIAILVGLKMMNPSELIVSKPTARSRGQIREAVAYVRSTPALFGALALVGIIGTAGLNFIVLVPLLAKNSYHGGAGLSGALLAAFSVGGACGALYAGVRRKGGVSRMLKISMLFSVAWSCVAIAPNAWTVLPLLMISGWFSMMFLTTANTTVQLQANPKLRGRVMSLYALLVLGSTPIGGPISGWLADHTNPRISVLLGGLVCVIGTGLLQVVARLHTKRALRHTNTAMGFDNRGASTERAQKAFGTTLDPAIDASTV